MFSGTTWLRWVTYLILHQDKIGQEMEKGTHLVYDAPYMEFKIPMEKALSKPSPRMFTSHLPLGHIKHYITDNKAKVIHVRRQIPDVLTSFYHFYQTNPRFGTFKGSFDDFFKLFEARHLLYGDPIEYNQDWWDARGNDNILYVTYEEMKKDIRDVIGKAASFLNKSVNDVTVDRIAEATSISAMRKTPYVIPVMKQIQEGEMTASQFYRKGVVGDWKLHFNAEQTAYLKERLKKTSVPFG